MDINDISFMTPISMNFVILINIYQTIIYTITFKMFTYYSY